MPLPIPMEKNFLAAMLHGRRSRLAENDRLDELCRIRTVEDLAQVLFPGESIESATALQRRMVSSLMHELDRLAGATAEDRRALLPWLRIRFLTENLKVMVRGRATHAAVETLSSYLIPLPRELTLDVSKMLEADSAEAFFALIPNSVLRKRLKILDKICVNHTESFYLETALDHAYLSERVFRAQGIGEDRELILAAVRQEVDIFHLMLAARGKLGYGLSPETLSGLYVHGGMPRKRFFNMLAANDLSALIKLAVGWVIDSSPRANDPAELEILAWNRLFRLANKAFRQGHMGMGAVIGYTILRRIELANLISLCEGIRTEVPPESLRARLIPCGMKEDVAHV